MINTSNFIVIFFIAPMHSSRRVEYFCHTSFGLNPFHSLAILAQSRMASRGRKLVVGRAGPRLDRGPPFDGGSALGSDVGLAEVRCSSVVQKSEIAVS
jgi:hypothetical protein